MAMAHQPLPSQRQNPLPPPPLSINTPPPMDVASLVSDTNGLTYPTPSSSSSQRPNLTMPPTSTAPEPAPTSTMDNGRIYSLDIVQQPVRARMCGFGDKDRRPITPPPCIRLVVKDAATQKELEINDIDTSYFVLTVDLTNADATQEVNLVRHSITSPAISATTATSYPQNPEPTESVVPASSSYLPTSLNTQMQMPTAYSQPSQQIQYPPAYSQPPQQMQMPSIYTQAQQPAYTSAPMFPQVPTPYHQHQSYMQQQVPQAFAPPPLPISQAPQQSYFINSMTSPLTPTGPMVGGQGPLLSPSALSTPSCDPRSNPSGMYTRNLIGSLCVSAFKLTDPDNNLGVWFILQDLSVRTEGAFRLKMNFVNVGSVNSLQTLNTKSAPVLASCYSDIFHVFSAKKFPGVIESTNLSKCFATQGIKIPIRKDGVRGNERRPGDGDDDD